MQKIFSRNALFALIVVATFGIVALTTLAPQAKACGFWNPCSSSETQTVADTQKKLQTAVPLPQLTNSLERQNISKRLTTFDDPAKISYIYLISYGKVMAFYTVKGKVTSGNKRLTNTVREIGGCGDIISTDGGDHNNCSDGSFQAPAPELDGTYGTSGDYIYFWTTDGVYVQWNGEYMMADQPLQLATPPELVRTVSGK